MRHPAWLIGASSAWMASVANLPLWREMHRLSLLETAGGYAFAFALASMIGVLLAALLSLLAWRWTLKPAVALLLLASAAGAYFMLSAGIVIDRTMIVNVLQTDRREASALLSLPLALAMLLFGLLPACLAWRLRLDYGSWTRRIAQNLLLALFACIALGALAAASFEPLASNMRNHKQLRYMINPLNSVYALGHVASTPLRRVDSTIHPIGLDALAGTPQGAGARPPLLLLVLGETGRSGNFGLNGYQRATTPELAQEQVFSFRNAWSCGTSTAASVPCMFSHQGRSGFNERTQESENLLDLAQRAGLAVLWLDNQSGCKGVCDRVAHASTVDANDPRWCAGGECFDSVLLEGLDQRLAALPPERRARGTLLVLHPMGSHGPAYHRRSPEAFKRFKPECASTNLQSCGPGELVNAYDNSIAYTDHFLASAIRWLKARSDAYDPAMVYVADHGESLGENNLYLHGLPYAIAPDTQKLVPWITWLSPAFERRTTLHRDCLRAQSDRLVTHDHYFHSVLGLLDIRTALYRRDLDAYAPCLESAAATSLAAGARENADAPASLLQARLADGKGQAQMALRTCAEGARVEH
jgi:lipid A ethanolaminephosphotransferase